jgi:hypothetical protein
MYAPGHFHGGYREQTRVTLVHFKQRMSELQLLKSSLCAQESLQIRKIQRMRYLESPLKSFAFFGCPKATSTAEIRPPARGGLRCVMQYLVHSIHHQALEQRFLLLLSTPQARSHGPRLLCFLWP